MKLIVTVIIGLIITALLVEYDTYQHIQDKCYYNYYTHQDEPPANLFNMILNETEEGSWEIEQTTTGITITFIIPSK